MPDPWPIRLAREADIPTLEALIALSVRGLLAAYYPPDVLEASIGSAFGVDSQLIRDGSYFVIEHEGAPIACGGWSRRATTYGADRLHGREDTLLDPAKDPARIRAFFIHPDWARRGLGTAILQASESAARAARFTRALLIGTPAGEKLYVTRGYTAEERYDAPLPGGLKMPVIRMTKSLVH
jgi:GNAT superfamily N-acetyltransferase